jgi:hypothetical protein
VEEKLKDAEQALSKFKKDNLNHLNMELSHNGYVDYVNTTHITTLFVRVPDYRAQDWLASYEFMAEFVVPRSSRHKTLPCMISFSPNECYYLEKFSRRTTLLFSTFMCLEKMPLSLSRP